MKKSLHFCLSILFLSIGLTSYSTEIEKRNLVCPTASISYAGNPFCITNSNIQNVTLTGTDAYLGGVFSATPTGLVINPTTGAISLTTSLSGTYTITYEIPPGPGCSGLTATTTITVNEQPNAGSDGSITVCESSWTAIDLYSLITGEQPGGTWTRVAGTGGTFNAAAGTYTPVMGATPVSYFVYTLFGTPPCINDSSVATVYLNHQANAGLNGTYTICNSSNAPIDLFSIITGEETGGTWVRTSGTGGTFDAVAGTFTPAVGATTSTFIYTLVSSAPCINESSVATVAIGSAPSNITITGTTSICSGSSANLTITGTPNTVVTYTDGVNSMNVVLNASGIVTISVSPTVTTTYTLTNADLNGCGISIVGQSATVIVSPTPQFITQIPDMTICNGEMLDIASQLTSTQPGTSYLWSAMSSNVNLAIMNGDQTNINQIVNLINASEIGTINIEIQPRIGSCFGTSQQILIYVNPLPNSTPLVDGEFTSNDDGILLTPYILDTGLNTTDYSFEWYLNGVVIPSATSNTYSATTAGEYSVVVTNLTTNCMITSSAIVTEVILIDVVDLDTFPNPATDSLTFRNVNKVKSIQITNQLGQVVLTKEINLKNGTIDISDLKNGIYTIVFDTESERINQRIVKQ